MNNCENHNPVFVKLITSNGAIQLRKQCLCCGHHDGVNYKHSSVDDISSVPPLDAIKSAEYWRKAHELNMIEIKKQIKEDAQKRSDEYNNTYIQSAEWKAKRNYILNKYSGLCVLCFSKADVVHHLTYKRCDWRNGECNEDERDLIPLCYGCHNFVHGLSDEDAIELQP